MFSGQSEDAGEWPAQPGQPSNNGRSGWTTGIPAGAEDDSWGRINCGGWKDFSLDDPAPLGPNASKLDWLNLLSRVWLFGRRNPSVLKLMKDCYSSVSDPFEVARYMMVGSTDFKESKANTLAFATISELNTWLREKEERRYLKPSLETQEMVFTDVIKQKNSSLVREVCEAFRLQEIGCHFIPHIRQLLAGYKYKEACQFAVYLNLHSHFHNDDFVLPLILQDKSSIAEEFLRGSRSHLNDLIRQLDSILGSKNVPNEVENIALRLDVPCVRSEKFQHKPLSKLIARLAKSFDVPPDLCPNLSQKRKGGSLHFLLHKKYIDQSIASDNWDELVGQIVESDPEMQLELVQSLQQYNDTACAALWAKRCGVPWDKLPAAVQEALTNGDSVLNSSREEEEWDVDLSQFHKLSLPLSCVMMVDTRDSFNWFLRDMSKHTMIGFDSEWKPAVGANKESGVALMQFATREIVYILDVVALLRCLNPSDWTLLEKEVFGDPQIIIIGFGLSSDLQMLSKSLPNMSNLRRSMKGAMDLATLWNKLEIEFPQVFPYTCAESEAHKLGLNNLVNKCLGKPLNKGEQFSNWERRPLRESQLIYAALDAYCVLEVYDVLEERSRLLDVPFEELCWEVQSGRQSKTKRNTRHAATAATSSRGARLEYFSANSNHLELEAGGGVSTLPEEPPKRPNDLRVVCDTMLQGLAKYLRTCGVDAIALDNHIDHDKCVDISERQGRIILTKGSVFQRLSQYVPVNMCYQVISEGAKEQLEEVLTRYNVHVTKADVFSRCQECNSVEFAILNQLHVSDLIRHPRLNVRGARGHLSTGSYFREGTLVGEGNGPWVDIGTGTTQTGVEVQVASIPAAVVDKVNRYYVCIMCGKVYWDGSHLDRVLEGRLKGILAED